MTPSVEAISVTNTRFLCFYKRTGISGGAQEKQQQLIDSNNRRESAGQDGRLWQLDDEGELSENRQNNAGYQTVLTSELKRGITLTKEQAGEDNIWLYLQDLYLQ